MRLQKFNQLINSDRFAKIIWFNFIELQNQPNVVFNIDDISQTLDSPNLLGWFLLNSNGNIIGYIVGETKELTDGRLVYWISYFYLMKQFRSMGLGSKMLSQCINYIQSIGISWIMLISNIHSNAFQLYKSFGFGFDPIIKINNSNYSVLTLNTN